MTALVLRGDHDGVATLTLNRPDKLNALNAELFHELAAHVAAIGPATDRVGAVVLRGAGRCFSAGHDLAGLQDGESLDSMRFEAGVVEAIANLPQPVIVAVHGHCCTGALELALAGDLILCSESARFADTHAKWSLVPLWGMSQRLPRRIGAYKAREMMYTARTYTGREAEAMGLVESCVADNLFETELSTLLGSIVANSWHSHRANKRLLIETDATPLAVGLAHETYCSAGFGPDFKSRINRFLSRSPPQR
jgi:enoyl-CoA hydratase